MSGTPQPGFSVEYCYRHPGIVTGVHCTRCGNPICPDCMVPAPVGYHCPDCVNAAKKEFKMGARRRVRSATGSMTKLLLVAIWAVFAIEVVVAKGNVLGTPGVQQLRDLGATYAPDISAGQYWRFLSSMFLHAGLIHILMNSYALYILGPPVEQFLGRLRFLALYVASGIVGGAFAYAFEPGLGSIAHPLKMVVSPVGVGASGAIVGVFGAFIAFNWRRRHTAMGQALLRNAVFIILINVILSVYVSVIDWRAHLGGLVAGFLAGYLSEETDRKRLGWGGQAAVFGLTTLVGVVLIVWRTSALNAAGPTGLPGLLGG